MSVLSPWTTFFFKTSSFASKGKAFFNMISKCRLHIFSLAKHLIRSPLGFLLWVSCSVNAGQAHRQAVASVAQRLKETLTSSWTSAWRSTAGSASFTLPLSKWSMRMFPCGGTLRIFFAITTVESTKCMREPDLNLLIISEILSHKKYNQTLQHEFHHTDKQ